MDELFVFKKILLDADADGIAVLHEAAMEKLQTLYPGKRITTFDAMTIGIETDSYYSETGTDTYELGMMDGEIPALRNTRDDEVITFRV